MMNPFLFNIEHIWTLVLLLPCTLIFWILLKKKILQRDVISYPVAQDKNRKIASAWPLKIVTFLEGSILILAVLALSGPFRSFEIVSIEEEGIDILLTLDISSSMQAQDFPPNRLKATQKIVKEFLRRSGGNRVGIVVFGKHVYTLSPLTSEHAFLNKLAAGPSLETIDHFQSGGTAIGDALLYALDTLRAAKLNHREQVIILLTDGDNNDGSEPSLAAKWAASQNIKIHTIGLGGKTPVVVVPDPSQPDWSFETQLTEETLLEIAHATQGRYFSAEDPEILAAVFDELSRLERTPLRTSTFEQKKYLRQPIAIIISFLFAFLIGLRVLFLRRPLK